MKKWAEREVELAIARERAAEKEDAEKNGEVYDENSFSYGGECYKSALKAFNSLLEDGHSGMSIGFTKQILNRLIDNKCLTPIEDTDDVWMIVDSLSSDNASFRCTRMSSLFKDVYIDGTVKYSDIDRIVCYADDSNCGFYTKRAKDVVDDLYPITMPYMPSDKPYKVFFHTSDDDEPYKLITPDGEVVALATEDK